MTETATDDRPSVRTVLDVEGEALVETLTSLVHQVDGDELVVAVGRRPDGRGVRVDVGTPLAVLWKGDGCVLRLPVEVTGSGSGEEPTWTLQVTGPVSRVQRREAVRAELRVPVTLTAGGEDQVGSTVDLSETGLRCIVAAAPVDPDGRRARERGDELDAVLDLGGTPVRGRVRLVRTHPRSDRRWEASLQFLDLAERDEDRVREAVFARLRELRAQGHA